MKNLTSAEKKIVAVTAVLTFIAMIGSHILPETASRESKRLVMLAILAVHCVWALLLGVFYKAKPELQQEKIEKSGLTRWKYVFFIFLMVVVGFTYEYLSDKYYFRPKLEELINDYKK